MSMSISSSYTPILASYKQTTARAASSSAAFGVEQVEETAETAPKTLEEYKKEFLAKVDALPIHPSQSQARQSLSIHENVFKKMMDDPAYEAEIFDQIAGSLAEDFSIAPPAFCTTRFDADGVYSGSAGGSAHMGKFETMSADAVWRREPSSSAKQADAKDKDKKAREKKDDLERFLEELYARKRERKDALLESCQYGLLKGYGASSTQPSLFDAIAK